MAAQYVATGTQADSCTATTLSSSTSQQIDAISYHCRCQYRRKHEFRAITTHVMRFLIRKQSANVDKADRGGDDQRQPDKNERQPS